MITEILCSYCLCLSVAVQNGGNCHKCVSNVYQSEILKVVRELNSASEFMSLSCYPKGEKPLTDFRKQGSIVSKGGKE